MSLLNGCIICIIRIGKLIFGKEESHGLVNFSGLIPNFAYHDLKLICGIRNKFAHAIIADLNFSDTSIVQRIEKFIAGPKKIAELSEPKTKFTIVVAQYVAILQAIEHMLSKARPPHLVELFKLNE